MRIRRQLIRRACPLKSRALSQSWRRSLMLSRHWRQSRAGSRSWQQSRPWLEVLRQVAQEYIDRRDRDTDPPGRFDKAGRWYAHETERRDCCWPIRSPSRAYPYSWLVHCRSAKHVAALLGVPYKLALRRARLMDER